MQVQYEFRKTGRKVTHIKLKFKEKPKQAQIATETLKATSDSLNTIKPLTEPQIAKYSMILCKLGSISDLAGTMDYPTFANWLGNILREPKTVIKKRLNVCSNIKNRNRLQLKNMIL